MTEPAKRSIKSGFTAIFVSFLISACAASSQTTYEAELAVLSNTAQVQDCQTCSGGRAVTGVGGDSDGKVTFNINAGRPGLYPLTINYIVSDDRPMMVTVNTNAVFTSVFLHTSPPGSDTDSSRTIYVPFQSGNNVVAFDEPGQNAPDLDDVVVGASPVESAAISGRISDQNGNGLAHVEVSLSAFGLEMKTMTGATALYAFPFLVNGDYYIRPKLNGFSFLPFEFYCPATNASQIHRSFIGQKLPFPHRKIYVMRAARASRAMMRRWPMSQQAGQWRIEYDLKHGTADIFHDGILLISHAVAVARVPQSVTSRDYKSRKVYRRPIHDGFGDGVEYVVASSGGGTGTMTQRFWLYNNADFFLTDVTINRKGGVASNYMSPLCAENESSFLPDGDNRALFVPFDNDKWIRYNAVPFGSAVTSYEVSAFYNNATRYGLVIGSVEHDVWKTGIQSVTTANGLAAIEVFGGIASPLTRDVLPHGKVSGQTVRSPKIFVGWYSDWRDGLDAYAKANATVAPRRAWSGGPPFGWNSWGKLQFRLTFDKAIQVSDFFAKKLPSFKDDRVAYIGLDAGWNIFSDQQLKQFVAHCQSNGQQAGIYFTPFAAWGAHDDALIPGTQYHYRDIYAYANGRRESIAGGVALDPTHPGTQALIASAIAEFKKAGFTYVKADFLTQGALEADKYFDPRVTTGIEAYNEGMRFVDRQLGPGIFLNESIAPLFPARYANSRRIACDSFGSIAQVEYTLNSVTYGWWLARVYDFNDPDEMVLDGYTENENRARVTSAAITGNFISGDDFSDDGSAAGKERAEKFLANDEINKVARMRQKFRPVEGNTGPRAANLFYLEDGNNCYIAAFNYSQDPANWTLNLKRIGINAGNGSCATNLWNGTVQRMTNGLDIGLGPADATIYKFAIRGGFIHDGRDPHSSGHRHLP